MIRGNQPLRQHTQLRRSVLKSKGPQTTLWETFREKKAKLDRDDEGLIKCQDWMMGLPRCGVAIPSPHLHHIFNRDARPDLYFHNSNLVWLVEGCHDLAHDKYSSRTSTQASYDTKRRLETKTSRNALSSVQGRPETRSKGDSRTEVPGYLSSVDARFVVKEKTSTDARQTTSAEA